MKLKKNITPSELSSSAPFKTNFGDPKDDSLFVGFNLSVFDDLGLLNG
jgi:hypothetical protein